MTHHFWKQTEDGMVNISVSPRVALLIGEALQEFVGMRRDCPEYALAEELASSLYMKGLQVTTKGHSTKWPED